MDKRLRYLADRDEIDTALSTYCRGIDRHDSSLIERAYFPEAYDNHGPFQNKVADGFAAWGNALHAERTRAHLHHRTTKSVQIDGDTAHSDTYVIFTLFMREADEVQFGHGRYLDRLERREGEWRIADRRTTIDMRMLGDANCYAALNRGTQMSAGAYPPGRWDRQDLSYLYPFDLSDQLRARLEANGPRPPRGELTSASAFEDAGLGGEALIERLLDRQTIVDTVADSLRGIDRRSVQLASGRFAAEAKVDSGGRVLPARAFIEAEIALGEGQDEIQARNMTTHLASFGAGGAITETYVIEMRRRLNGTDVWVAGVRLLDHLVRAKEGWQIAHRTMVRDWEFLSRAAVFSREDGYLRSADDPTDVLKTDARDQRAATAA